MMEKTIDLALAVYRLTKLFPEGEVLIGQMRQAANFVLADLIKEDYKNAYQQIKTLLAFFQIAEKQNWTKSLNFAILNREYGDLLATIERASQESEKVAKKPEKTGKSAKKKTIKISQRQKKILEFIKDKKLVQAKDLLGFFPKFNVRTIRRDLLELVKRKIIFQKGRGRASFYRVYRIDEGNNKDT